MKKLIAAAVAAAVIAPASVMATGPTLYGKIHMSVDNHDNNGSSTDGTKYDEWSLNSNNSAIGIKGSEDMGNGMKVGYLVEWTMAMDGDTTHGADASLGMRNRAITMSGKWGTVLAGRWNSPFKMLNRKLDLFGDRIGDTRNLSKFSTSENYLNNVVSYVTPNMNGFSAVAAYSFDSLTGTNDDSDNSALSFSALYKNGPAMLGLAYIDYDDRNKGAGFDNATAWRLGGSYKFGDFKVVGSYTDFESQDFKENKDPDLWIIGAAYKMGNNTIKFQYSDLDDSGLKTCSSTGAEGSGALSCKDGADMWSIGLDHAMSKRTTVYVAYATTDNGDNSARTSWFGGHDREGAPSRGNDADAFSVGIFHKF